MGQMIAAANCVWEVFFRFYNVTSSLWISVWAAKKRKQKKYKRYLITQEILKKSGTKRNNYFLLLPSSEPKRYCWLMISIVDIYAKYSLTCLPDLPPRNNLLPGKKDIFQFLTFHWSHSKTRISSLLHQP